MSCCAAPATLAGASRYDHGWMASQQPGIIARDARRQADDGWRLGRRAAARLATFRLTAAEG
jgi:hypothetical protein